MKPVPHGEPYAGKLHVRFDEGADVPDEGRLALLHQLDDANRRLRPKINDRFLCLKSGFLISTLFSSVD